MPNFNSNVNVFEAASLIQMQTGTWQASKTLTKEEIEILADPEWVKGKKLLVDKDFLAGPRKIITAARTYLGEMALPFPIPGLLLVSKDVIRRIDERLTAYRTEFFAKVNEIANGYPEAREQARSFLEPRNLFRESDYPADINELYNFAWRYMDITVPAKLQQMAPEIYARQLADFQKLLNDAQEVAITALYDEVADLVERMVDRLDSDEDGKPRKFKDSLINNFTSFFETFKDRNIFDNPRLNEIVEKAQATLKGVTADSLCKLPDVRKKIKNEMAGVKQAIDEACVDLPRRKFKLDPNQMEKAA
ncbi:MAG: DUF3150 domain-containing protein [Syntrophobacteraceae bacterium]